MKTRFAAAVTAGLLAVTLSAGPAAADHGTLWPDQRTWVCKWFPAIC